MKNIKLGTKLIGGFICTVLIVIFVGLTGIVEQGKLSRNSGQLGEESIPAVKDILMIKSEASKISSLMHALLTPYATIEERNASHQGLLDTRKKYGAAVKEFKDLEFAEEVRPEIADFDENIAKWAKVNNQVVAMSKELIAKDIVNPSILKDHMANIEIGHQQLLAKLGKMLSSGQQFEGGTDGTACALGKWMGNMDTNNREIVQLAEKLRPIHLQLHEKAAAVKQLVFKGDEYRAKTVMVEELYPLSEQVFDIVHEMNNVTEVANHDFEKMSHLLLIDAALHQKNTFAALDEIVDKAVAQAATRVTEGEAIATEGRIIIGIGITLGIVFALGLGFYLTSSIKGPLTKGVDLSKAMAEGDMTRTMDVQQKDEIGVLADSLNSMSGNLRLIIKDINQGVNSVDHSSTQLASIAEQMSSSAESTAQRSNQVSVAAEEMSTNQDTVAAAMEQAAVNVNMVASATEEMRSTIGEIAENSSRAKEITTQAVNQSQEASDRVDDLGKAANEINKVTEVITEISEQTNLLALNATIEAARAGDAGKGFAVVANEIKDLAKQTAEATLDIKNKVEGIQGATGITVKEINQISSVISDVDTIVATIAAAVEEQTSTTGEIAENVTQVSQGINEVNENVAQSSQVSTEIARDIGEVNSSANEMNSASDQVKESAEELSSVADRLKEMVATFKV